MVVSVHLGDAGVAGGTPAAAGGNLKRRRGTRRKRCGGLGRQAGDGDASGRRLCNCTQCVEYTTARNAALQRLHSVMLMLVRHVQYRTPNDQVKCQTVCRRGCEERVTHLPRLQLPAPRSSWPTCSAAAAWHLSPAVTAAPPAQHPATNLCVNHRRAAYSTSMHKSNSAHHTHQACRTLDLNGRLCC